MDNVVENSKTIPKKSITAKQLAKSHLTKRKNPDWDNLDRGYRYLTLDMKLPHDLAIALMGNVIEESLGNHKAVLKNGGGKGLILWDGRKAPSGRYELWGSIWASVAKPANVYDPTTDTVKNYWAPWNGLKGDKVRLEFIKAPLKKKASIYAESYLRPGKPRIADRLLSTMQLDSIYNPRIKNIIIKKNGGKIDRMLIGGPIYLSAEDIKNGANTLGSAFLKGLGAAGRFLNAGFTSPTYGTTGLVSYARNAKDAKRQKELSEASEQALGKAMTWVSPLNYGAAVWNGHGLDARKGEEEVASWSPAWQAVGRLGELYIGPKAIKGVKAAPKVVVNTAAKAGVKPAKAAVVAREIKQATKNAKLDNNSTVIPHEDLFDFWHGGLESDFDFGNLDVLRKASKQSKRNRNYAGFYMYSTPRLLGAFNYGFGEAHGIKLKPNAKKLKVNFNTERIEALELLNYRNQGYDYIEGKDVWGEPEYILLNKDAIQHTGFFDNSLGHNVHLRSRQIPKIDLSMKKVPEKTSLAFFERKPSKSVTREYVQSPKDITSDVGDLIAEGSERSVYASKSNPNIVYKIEDGNAPLEDISNIKIRPEINDDVIAPETTIGYYKHKNGKYYRVTQQDKYKSYNPDNFYEEVSPELNLEIIKTLEKSGWKVNIENGHATTASKNGIIIGNLEHFNWGRDSKGNLKLIDLYVAERNPSENNIVGASYDYRMEDPKGSMDFLKLFFALLKINGKEYTLEGLKDAKNVQQGLPEYIQSYLNLNTVERAVRAMRKNGYSEREIQLYINKVNEVMNKVKVGMYSDLEYNAAGALDFGGFYNKESNFISVNKDAHLKDSKFTPEYIMKHEGRHLIDYNTSMTDDVINTLEKAYDKDFLEIPKHEDAGSLKDYQHMDRERVTTNRDARDVLLTSKGKYLLNKHDFIIDSSKRGYSTDMIDFLNKIIKYVLPEDIVNAVENSNGYGKRYINYLKKNNKLTPTKIEQLRLAMIKVPSYILPVAGGYTLYNLFNQPLQQLQYLKQGGKMNKIRKMQTAAGGPIKKSIKRLKDGYRYIPDKENGGWDRISDNSMSDVFATYIVKGKDKRADVRIDKKSENFDRKFKYDETEIPFIKDKEITLTNAGLYTGAKLSTNLLDSIAKYAKISGLPLKTAVGLVAKETSLGNPTVDSSLKKLAGDDFAYQLAKALNGGLHINEGIALNPKDLINFHYEELNPYLGLKNLAYKKSVGNMGDYGREGPFGDENFLKRYRELLKLGENYSDNLAKKLLSNFNPNKNVLQAGFEFYKLNPRKYNYNQTNYPQLVEERGNMVYNSPEFKSWLSTSEYKKQGGKMNAIEQFKEGHKIHIKKKNRGKYFKSINKYVNV